MESQEKEIKEAKLAGQHVIIGIVITYLLAAAVGACASLPVFSQNILQDEAFSVVLVRKGISGMIAGTAADVHPPLYYLMMMAVKFLLGGRESLTAYRFLSLLGTWFHLLLVGATLVRKRWGAVSASIYILFFGLSYYTLEYSVIVRMYSWGTFFVTLTALLALRFYEQGKTRDLILCGISTLLAMYTHYYALLTVFLIWLFLLLGGMKKKILLKRILLAGILITAGYLPWLGVFFRQTNSVADYYWIPVVLTNELINAPWYMTETNALPGTGNMFQMLLVLVFLLSIVRKKYTAVICGVIAAGVLAIAAVFSVCIQPIWIVRYFYILWGLLALMTAITTGERYTSLSFLPQILLCLFLLVYGCFSVKSMMGEEIMQTNAEGWNAYLNENVDSDAFIMVDDYVERSMMYQYFFPEADLLMLESATEKDVASFVNSAEGGQLWYLPNDVFIVFGEEKMEQTLMRCGYRMLDEDAEACHMENGHMRIRRIEEVIADE